MVRVYSRGIPRLYANLRARDTVARQVEEGCGGQLAADNAEAGVRGGWGGILHGVPPGVGRAEEGAAYLVPVGLGIFEAGHSLARGGARHGEACLRHPDWLAVDGGGSGVEGIEEETLVVINSIGIRGLEVRVRIDAGPVDGIDDGLVGTVDPGGPGVDVADGSPRERSARDGAADLLDVTGDDVRAGTGILMVRDARGRDAVQILAADRDTGD